MKQLSPDTEKVAKKFKTKFSKKALSKVVGGGWLSKKNSKAEQEPAHSDPISSPVTGQNISKLRTDEYTSLSEGGISRLFRGDGAANIVAKTINFMRKAHEQKIELRELENDLKKEQHEKDERTHSELMNAFGVDSGKPTASKAIAKGEEPNKKKEKKDGIIKKILKFINDNPEIAGVAAGLAVNSYNKAVEYIKSYTPNTPDVSTISDKISKLESGGNYNQMNNAGNADVGGGKVVKGALNPITKQKYPQNLTDMTIPQVIDLSVARGNAFKHKDKQGHVVSSTGKAAGAFQFMPETLLEYAKKVFPKTWKTQKFDKEAQDKLKQAYLSDLINKLKYRKIPVTPQNIRFGQFVGGGADSLKRFSEAPDDMSMQDVLSKREAASNVDIAKLSVGQYKAKLYTAGLDNLPTVADEVPQSPVVIINNSTNINSSVSKRNINVMQDAPPSDLPIILNKNAK